MEMQALLTDGFRVQLFRYFIMTVVISALVSVWLESFIPFLFPFSILLLSSILSDYRRLFYLLFAVLPFSVEFYFEGAGLGTDVPSEPIMILLTAIALAVFLRYRLSLPMYVFRHPISILLLLHLCWIGVTSLQSTHLLISLKFLAAKIWYIIPFFFLPLMMVKERADFEKAYRVLYTFLFIAIVIVLVRHAFEGFTFAASYDVVRPFFRNHVNYAAICVVCLPFVWAFYRIRRGEGKSALLLLWVFVIFIVGIYFSFTRAAILSMLIALIAAYIIRRYWVRQALMISGVAAVALVLFLSLGNRFMDFTPEFERTITHTEFDNLIEATYKLEDISSMERVYRWMAGVEMIRHRFWLGFGPGTFYSNYKSYSISSFRTYVSENKEKSGIHNYFLMTWVEQGCIGFFLFLALCCVLLLEGERLYHKCKDERDKLIILAATLGFVIIFAMCLINDLIETDKVGPFFFFNAALLVYYAGILRDPTGDTTGGTPSGCNQEQYGANK